MHDDTIDPSEAPTEPAIPAARPVEEQIALIFRAFNALRADRPDAALDACHDPCHDEDG